MEAFRKQFEKELSNLEVTEKEEITVKVLSKKFKKKAFKLHPDKTGNNEDEQFKELLNDFNIVLAAYKSINKDENDDSDENDDKGELFTFFDKHNVATEKSQSWTVVVEKSKVGSWSNVLKTKFGQPKVIVGGSGDQYKAPVGDKNVSITFYKTPSDLTPKMSIQGSPECLRFFVINVLPSLYKKVCEKENKSTTKSIADKNAHKENVFKCNMCGKPYKQKGSLKTHMEKNAQRITG